MGSSIDIHFLNGSDSQKATFRQYVAQWAELVNLLLRFDAPKNGSEIRVKFDDKGGNWSALGTNCLVYGPDDTTMNIGQVAGNVILHEFGHAIGCIHEHQSPAQAINWNKPKVYSELGGPPNFWDQKKVDVNLFNKYSATTTQYSAFDPKSIMMYPIRSSWTLDGFSVGWNQALSVIDKAFIRKSYPGCVVDFSKPTIQMGGCKVNTGPGTTYNQYYGNSWLMHYPNNSYIEVKLRQPKQYAGKDIYSKSLLRLTHLMSAGNPQGSPIDIIVNGNVVAANYNPPSTNWVNGEWNITQWMKDGDNVVLLKFKSGVTNYWINRLEIYCERVL